MSDKTVKVVPILDWIGFGKVSAERDDLLSEYFYDNGVLNSVVNAQTSFLILGRKGAGKTAVFRHLIDKRAEFLKQDDILVALSFEDYNWNIHSLMMNENKAESLLYKQSWRFVILVECIKAFFNFYSQNGSDIPPLIRDSHSLLEKIFDSPVPTIYQIIGRKLLSLSKLKLPKGGMGSGGDINLDGGEVSFDQVKSDKGLIDTLSQNIEHIIEIFEGALSSLPSNAPRLFICFDKVDEAWDDVSYETSKKVIAGLISASEAINTHYKGKIRPIVFLREDIFDVLSINDANKLREDCGELLKWDKASLSNMLLRRINYFGEEKGISNITDLDSLFDKQEMRQRTKPLNYLVKRTMMRPRDLIALMNRVVDTMKEKADDPFADEQISYEKLEAESIYGAEAGYSEWLKKEIEDEWAVQKPFINDLFNAIQNKASTNFTSEELEVELKKIDPRISSSEVSAHLRFLFDNSIVGFKVGDSKEWRFKCFYPSQGFLDSDEYRVHEGLVRALSLKEARDREESETPVATEGKL